MYVAPSWSWASLAAGTQVRFYNDNKGYDTPQEKHVEILDVVCKPVGLDPTGALQSGYLVSVGKPCLLICGLII